MELNPIIHSKHSNGQTTLQTMVTPSNCYDSGEGTATNMLNNAQNTHINGGTFALSTNFNRVDGPSLEVLHKRVAPNAILNAGGRADEVRCHPGTRKEVICRIEKWRVDTLNDIASPIFWLSGAAGAGKTAIMQTIAEGWKQEAVPQANFFFFRSDTSRSNSSALVATLLHQVTLLYSSLRDPVANILLTNPLIFDSGLEEQLTQLIFTPLHGIRQSSSNYHPLMLVIDGLDECDAESKRSQRRIIHAFDKVLAKHPGLVCLLVASRDESLIRTAFNDLSSALLPLYLDGEYANERDIRVFVNDQFEKIRKTHPLAHTLNTTWPSFRDSENIVTKSSGQFIYAATVMRFLSDSSASPVLSLERVKGVAQIATKSPFSQLDTIYTYILSQVDDQPALKNILHAHFLIRDALQWKYHEGLNRSMVGLAQLLTVCQSQSYTDAFVM
ncbi:hypothetical protein D9619_011114 [Psilocybe cf. subviscida]|uniref:NACHT domain-containing protein n=1 Tax=Psilocybe cf. subviscida TaxID=2480587 RepID=A0A8H5F5N5_9AGAR|nr:hypothetical protein D9619_011114 [Psilocybe cf. subviscida]